ncbi:DUF2784 domain-containing protein [Rhizobacter sp. AJA081-3]|uniref:DUF2784 domain-containing protein n=1 Tax=Rhizobacter sp. AJA081-3 TaxID=2753607 RepID=UPI001AE07DCD|nr:DUF2784 domain-containing protein [Rhizobacter sp. AJA081-3]QTN21544.1 DUF2784 domain-containing protein [Rhizobacter sp. AJA081-3]
MPYQPLADAVLVIHFGVVLFVVGGLVVVVAGNWLRWRWVNQLWFRLAHLAAIAVVVLQAWLGQYCPLTTFESWLRVQAGAAAYERSFIEHWLQRLIFYEAPFWVFTVAYTAFAVLVLLVWWRYPPRRGSGRGSDA